MIRPVIKLKRRRILVDVDTQTDLFFERGKACVKNHRRILANIRRVVAWARLKNIRMISTKIINDPSKFNCPEYCLAETDGQRKISYTVRGNHVHYAADGYTDLPRDLLRHYDQVILQKRVFDPFDEPRADRIFTELKADEFIVFGGLIEEAVKATVLGILTRRKNVTLLTDAIGYHDKAASEVALRQMEAKGAVLKETKALLGVSHLRLLSGCGCDRCLGKLQKEEVSAGISG